MRALDPRLLRRTESVRPLLAIDTVLGLATVAPVIAQATLLAHIVARAFEGASLSDVRLDLVLLVMAFAARGLLGWGMEVAGRRAASSTLSELRLELAAHRLGREPLATDGAESGELAAAAVQGVDALEAYFARYLPQVALAALAPPAILVWTFPRDPAAAAILAVTFPLIPVFMVLIGKQASRRTRARWRTLSVLSA